MYLSCIKEGSNVQLSGVYVNVLVILKRLRLLLHSGGINRGCTVRLSTQVDTSSLPP